MRQKKILHMRMYTYTWTEKENPEYFPGWPTLGGGDTSTEATGI
jgi:hypothetical protein